MNPNSTKINLLQYIRHGFPNSIVKKRNCVNTIDEIAATEWILEKRGKKNRRYFSDNHSKSSVKLTA